MILFNIFAHFLVNVNANFLANCLETVKICDFKVSKAPYFNAVVVTRTGLNKFECLGVMKQFDWSVGIHCEPSLYCGLGLDDSRDYTSFQTSEVEPLSELCEVYVDSLTAKCDVFKSTLYDVGILKSKYIVR